MTVTENINHFCEYFEGQLEVISNIKVDSSTLSLSPIIHNQVRYYIKTLLVTGVDALAGIRYPKPNYPQLNSSNRKRFIRFVKEFADWQNGDLVSLAFLKDRLMKQSHLGTPLGTYISKIIDKKDPSAGGHIEISTIDEPTINLLTLATTEREEEAITDNQHYNLLYRYRNYLVHEWREPGSSMEVDSLNEEPYYHGYIKNSEWYLVYPIQVFKKIFSESISNFKQYLMANLIDPYSFVNDTRRW